MTEGLAVLVHEVMDAMTRDPSPIIPPTGFLFSFTPRASRAASKLPLISLMGMRSWGRLYPARQGSTVERSSSRVSVYSGSEPYHMVCSFMYFSTASMCFSSRPVRRRYSMVRSSTGQYPMVAPYSGAMLARVDLSGSDRLVYPGPKNSTNLPTTPFFLSMLTTVRTRSVALTPSLSSPESLNPMTSGRGM